MWMTRAWIVISVMLLAGCGESPSVRQDGVINGTYVKTIGPDKYGVVCYRDIGGSHGNSISCVKVQ